MKKILFIVAHRPGRSPGQRFRFEQYLDYLREHGFEYEYSYIISEKDDGYFYSKGHYFKKFLIFSKSILKRFHDLRKAKKSDIVFIYREAMFGTAFFEKRFKRKGAKIIFDFDDSIWLLDVSHGNNNLGWLKRPSKTSRIIQLADMIFAGNQYLAGYARQFNDNVKVIPTTIDTRYYVKQKVDKPEGRICIGWTGSSTTLKHFDLAVPFLLKLKEKYPGKLIFRLISDEPCKGNQLPIDFCKWNRETEIKDLCYMDIGIMPLPDDDWAKGKCGFKGLQYMSLEISAVMSPIGVNNEIITDGKDGFLAGDENEWINKISMLIESAALRETIGKKGRERVIAKYSFDSQKEQYLKYFNSLT